MTAHRADTVGARIRIATVVAALAAAWPAAGRAGVEEGDWNTKFQSTYVFQKKLSFDAP